MVFYRSYIFRLLLPKQIAADIEAAHVDCVIVKDYPDLDGIVLKPGG